MRSQKLRITALGAILALVVVACAYGPDPIEAHEIDETTTTTVPAETTTTAATATATLLPTTTPTTTIIPSTGEWDTTTTTTEAEVEIGCGAEYEDLYERRYWFDGERPAPLGVLWEENVGFFAENGNRSVVLSGIFLGVSTEEFALTSKRTTEAFIAVFCFGEDTNGNALVARFNLSITESLNLFGFHWKAVNRANLNEEIDDILPFGRSIEVDGVVSSIACGQCRLTPQDVLDVLVVGRQYAVEILVYSEPVVVDGYEEEEESFQNSLSNNRAIVDYLLGRAPAPPGGTIGTMENAVWFAPTWLI